MDETDALLTELATFFGLVTRATRGSDEDPVLTGTQRLAMMNIADAGPLRLHELGDRMGTTDPTASRAVDALVSAGLVQRVVDPRDRRALQIAVTREGRSRVDQRRAQIARLVAPAVERLSVRERKQIVALLARLNDELRETTGDDVTPAAFLAAGR